VIDLHSHVLPGLDDGAADLPEALELAAAAAADGVTTMAATPHLRADHPRVRPAELASQVDHLQREIDRAGIALELIAGGEVDLAWACRASDADLRLVSYGRRESDLLLETPYGHLPGAFESLVRRLRERGFRLLLAHPERSPTFQEEPRRLAALVRDGVLVQVGADSLTQLPRRSRRRRLASRIIGEGLAHVLASDLHGMRVGRAPSLSAAVAAADGLAHGRGTWMAAGAPAAILAGEPPGAPPVGSAPTRRRPVSRVSAALRSGTRPYWLAPEGPPDLAQRVAQQAGREQDEGEQVRHAPRRDGC
jgi:protein-tyrosine phosphatase